MTHRDDDRVSFAQPQRKNVVQPALLVSLHDVTPAHAARLARAEQLLSALGIEEVAYLYVPDFHGRAPAHRDPAFAAWCRAARPFRVQWFLHGYYHQELRERLGQNGQSAVSSLIDGDMAKPYSEGIDRLLQAVGHKTATAAKSV